MSTPIYDALCVDWQARGYVVPMTNEPVPTPEPAVETTEVAVEQPAKTTDTVEVDAAPETAGPAQPDPVTENLEAEPASE